MFYVFVESSYWSFNFTVCSILIIFLFLWFDSIRSPICCSFASRLFVGHYLKFLLVTGSSCTTYNLGFFVAFLSLHKRVQNMLRASFGLNCRALLLVVSFTDLWSKYICLTHNEANLTAMIVIAAGHHGSYRVIDHSNNVDVKVLQWYLH